MKPTQYMVSFRRYGQSEVLWQTTDFASLTYTLNLDDVTEVEFEPLYGAAIPDEVFDKTTLMQIWRKPRGATSFALEGNTEWIVTKEVVEYEVGPIARRKIVASHPNLVLQKRLIAYRSGELESEKTQENGNPGPIVLLMEQLINENLRDSAVDVDRRTNIALASISQVGPPVEVSAPWRQLLSTLQDLARQLDENGDRCYFALESQPAGMTLRISRGALGADLSETIIFSVESGNVGEMTITRDLGREINTIYVAGEGSGADQVVAEVNQPVLDPIYRWEDFLQAGYYITSDTALEAEGLRFLDASGARRYIRAKIIDAAPHVYGTDFNFGDAVGLWVGNKIFRCVIFAIQVEVKDGKESVQIYLDADDPL